MGDAVAVVTGTEEETTTEVVEEVADIVEELTETITDVVEELADVITEVTETTPAGAVTEEELSRYVELRDRIAALESRPWPTSIETVVAVAEEAANQAVTEVLEEIKDEVPDEEPEVTIVPPDVPEESTRKRSKLHPRNWW